MACWFLSILSLAKFLAMSGIGIVKILEKLGFCFACLPMLHFGNVLNSTKPDILAMPIYWPQTKWVTNFWIAIFFGLVEFGLNWTSRLQYEITNNCKVV